MELESNHLSGQTIHPPAATQWDAVVARWVSRVFSPATLTVLGIGLVAAATGSTSAWLWAGGYTILAVLLPVLYVAWQVRRGKITDFHIKLREQRIRPMLVTLALSILGWLMMLTGSAPYPLVLFAGVGVIQVAFLLVVTLWWKISGHCAAASGFSVFIFALFGLPAVPALLLIPLVAWARVRRNRHELGQTIAGSLVGIAYMLAFLYLVNLHGPGLTL